MSQVITSLIYPYNGVVCIFALMTYTKKETDGKEGKWQHEFVTGELREYAMVFHFCLEVNTNHLTLSATTHNKRNVFFYDSSTLHALLHEGRAVVTGTHVSTRLEEHCGLLVRAHHTLLDLKKVCGLIVCMCVLRNTISRTEHLENGTNCQMK